MLPAPCTHLPPQGMQTNLSKSLLVLEFPILVEILFYLMVEQVTCPLPAGKTLGPGVPGKASRVYPLMVYILSGVQLKDTEKLPPSQKILHGGQVERCRGNYPPSGKVLGWGCSIGKTSRNTQGSAERCRVFPVAGD